jgi:hypothetical protein
MHEKTLPLHEKLNKEIRFDKNDEKLSAYSTIFPSSNLTYYDLSPYVNTAEVFNRNIVQLKQEIRRILTESGVTNPTIQETAINKELEALTGYDTTLFAQPTKILSTSPTKSTPTSPTESSLLVSKISQSDTFTLTNTETKGKNSENQLSALAAEFIPKFSSKSWSNQGLQPISLTVSTSTAEAFTTVNPSISSIESAQTLVSTVPLHTKASTTLAAITTQETTTNISTIEAAISITNSNKNQNKIFVPAAIADPHETMAYPATSNAQAYTTGL